jgi:hypothetical protein
VIRVVETILALGCYVTQVLYCVAHKDTFINVFEPNSQPDVTGAWEAQERGSCEPPEQLRWDKEEAVQWPVSSSLYDIDEVTACSSR